MWLIAVVAVAPLFLARRGYGAGALRRLHFLRQQKWVIFLRPGV
jgi:hypothetical protein